MKPTNAAAVLIADRLHLFRTSRSFVFAERISELTGIRDRALLREIAQLDQTLADPNELARWAVSNGNARLRDLLEELASSKAYLVARSSSQIVNALKFQLAEPTAYSELVLLLRRSLNPEPIPFWDDNLEMALRANPYLGTEHPSVDIIVPVYGTWAYLNTAIIALARTVSVSFHLILVDDQSPEPVPTWLERIAGVSVLRRATNGGFAEACNTGARQARTPRLLLLNMDVQVQPDTVQHLVNRLDSSVDIGIVGGKLCYPNGMLQEAGGLLDAGGVVANLGHQQDPWHPDFNFVRLVDYVSGALLITRTELYHELGGLSNEFGTGYFEDTDLCMRVRQLGYHILYEPRAQAMHAGGGSFSEESKATLMSRNSSLFFRKWESELKLSPRLRSQRRSTRPRVLVVDSTVPVPDRDSGSADTFMMIRALREFDIDVAMYPIESSELDGVGAQRLQGLGVEVLYHPYIDHPADAVKCIEPVDWIFLFRYPAGGRHIDAFRQAAPQAKIIFLPVDLHYLRQSRGSSLGLLSISDKELLDMRSKELGAAESADEVWVLGENEANVLHNELPNQKIRIVPFFRSPPAASAALSSFDGRADIGFIGNFEHPPNVDAVSWFIDMTWRKILAEEPDLKLVIAGSNISRAPRDLWCQVENVEVVGWVPSEYDFLKTKVLSLAPLRFGAGIKGKVASSLLVGTPCVGTSVAFEGMNLSDHQVVVADDPEEMASAVLGILRSREHWSQLSKNGLERAQALWSYSAGQERLRAILNDLKLLPMVGVDGREVR
ncbi:MAG: glycosyltransferase [Ferrimicrobium sp.]